MCLAALPKNVVSSLVENIRVLKNDDSIESSTNTDSEINKQDGNVMKILITGNDSSKNGMVDRYLLVIGAFVVIICEVISIYLFADLY